VSRTPPHEVYESSHYHEYACLSVCLSVRSHISKTTRPNLTKFPISLRMLTGRGSVLIWRRSDTLCTSGYVDTSCFHTVGSMARVFSISKWREDGSRNYCIDMMFQTDFAQRWRSATTSWIAHWGRSLPSTIALFVYRESTYACSPLRVFTRLLSFCFLCVLRFISTQRSISLRMFTFPAASFIVPCIIGLKLCKSKRHSSGAVVV